MDGRLEPIDDDDDGQSEENDEIEDESESGWLTFRF